MSPTGRPEGEYRSPKGEGSPVSPTGRPEGEYRSPKGEGRPVSPTGRPEGEYRSLDGDGGRPASAGGSAHDAGSGSAGGEAASRPPGVSQLNAQHLRKRYKARTVVQDVSLGVTSGEVVGLLGPNGAGKTTCFYMIVGLVPMDGGSIRLDGEDLSHMPIHRRARRGLSYLPQEASIFRKLTVAQNVRAILELQGLGDEDAIANRLDALLEDLSISHLADAPAVSLSGGERRRVEIARALATRPRFILLDEPFAGVDPIAVLDIQKIIGFLKERGIGVLITDHNVRETLGICDRAYIINEGRVLASGAPGEIVYNEDVRKVYLGEHFRL
jgi:lipopolysaccharide export system ATP-binding protein